MGAGIDDRASNGRFSADNSGNAQKGSLACLNGLGARSASNATTTRPRIVSSDILLAGARKQNDAAFCYDEYNGVNYQVLSTLRRQHTHATLDAPQPVESGMGVRVMENRATISIKTFVQRALIVLACWLPAVSAD